MPWTFTFQNQTFFFLDTARTGHQISFAKWFLAKSDRYQKTLDKHEPFFSQTELHALHILSSQHNSSDFNELFIQYQETQDLTRQIELTFAAWGVQAICTVLGFTPFALGLLNKANRLFLLPLSPFGRDPLYLSKSTEKEQGPSSCIT